MAKRSMSDKLRNIKEGEIIPVEQKITFREGEETPGTSAKIEEEITIGPEIDPDEARPKPTPKKNRRGGQKLQAELEKQKELAEGNKEKYTRLLAEFDNMRARNEKENSQMSAKGAMDALDKILPVIDNLERALDNVKEDEKTPFEEGVEKIYKQLMDTLKDMGVEPMNAVEKEFDPTYHNAVIHVEDENLGENVVVEEMQKGYMYKDQVLRHAMVKVAN